MVARDRYVRSGDASALERDLADAVRRPGKLIDEAGLGFTYGARVLAYLGSYGPRTRADLLYDLGDDSMTDDERRGIVEQLIGQGRVVRSGRVLDLSPSEKEATR